MYNEDLHNTAKGYKMLVSKELQAEVASLQKFISRAMFFRDHVITPYQEGDHSIKWIPVDLQVDSYDMQFDMTNGLCYNLRFDNILIDESANDWFESWEFFSGDLSYPVPSILECGSVDKENCATRYMVGGGKYKGLYGEYRIHLLNHCLKKARERIIEIMDN